MNRRRALITGFFVLTAGIALLSVFYFEEIFYFTVPVVAKSPEQPVAFSHKQHSGEYGIHCSYCHRFAYISRTAGVPDMELCVSCHRFISPDKPEVKKLIGYSERGEPVPWIKVHDLPDFVYFPHKTHVRAGMDCGSCHGDVAAMDRMERVSHLAMRWCLDCHRERDVSIDCLQCHF